MDDDDDDEGEEEVLLEETGSREDGLGREDPAAEEEAIMVLVVEEAPWEVTAPWDVACCDAEEPDDGPRLDDATEVPGVEVDDTTVELVEPTVPELEALDPSSLPGFLPGHAMHNRARHHSARFMLSPRAKGRHVQT